METLPGHEMECQHVVSKTGGSIGDNVDDRGLELSLASGLSSIMETPY